MDSSVDSVSGYTDPPWGALGRDVTLAGVTLVSNAVLHLLNSLNFRDRELFEQHVLRRKPGTPLFTVCNHTSTLDDPILLGALLPWSFFWTESKHHGTRWSLCARELCYKYRLLRDFFQNGKTLPIDRGLGVEQPIMRLAARKAAQGDWVHIFPEARISYTGRLQPLRRGIGKLVCDSLLESAECGHYPSLAVAAGRECANDCGMSKVMPAGARVPRAGHAVHVAVGQPVELRDLTPRCNCERFDQQQVWADISKRIFEALCELESRCPPNVDQTPGAK